MRWQQKKIVWVFCLCVAFVVNTKAHCDVWVSDTFDIAVPTRSEEDEMNRQNLNVVNGFNEWMSEPTDWRTSYLAYEKWYKYAHLARAECCCCCGFHSSLSMRIGFDRFRARDIFETCWLFIVKSWCEIDSTLKQLRCDSFRFCQTHSARYLLMASGEGKPMMAKRQRQQRPKQWFSRQLSECLSNDDYVIGRDMDLIPYHNRTRVYIYILSPFGFALHKYW